MEHLPIQTFANSFQETNETIANSDIRYIIHSGFFSTIFRQLQANTCRNFELDEDFG